MKKFVKILGIISILGIIEFAFFSCGDAENSANVLSGSVTITGAAVVGQTLTVDINALGGSGIITFQWARGGNIAIGTNDISYVVQTADIGSTITVTVSRAGSTGNIISAPTAVVSENLILSDDNSDVIDNTELKINGLPDISIEQIINNTPIFDNITISRTNTDYPSMYPLSVIASNFDAGSIIWEVAGAGIYSGEIITSSSQMFILNANDVRYNTLGGHVLILTVKKNGLQYQKAIPFIIVQ